MSDDGGAALAGGVAGQQLINDAEAERKQREADSKKSK